MSLTGSMLSLTDLRCFLIKHIIFRQKKYMQYYLAPVNEGYIYLYMTCGECERDDAKR